MELDDLFSGGRGLERLVVVAEDDPEMRALIVTALWKQGFEVVGVADGPDLLDAVAGTDLFAGARRRVDLVITDNRMPRATGLDAIAAMRAGGWRIPVVVLSAFCTDEVRSEAARLGAVAVVEKPVDLAALSELAVAMTSGAQGATAEAVSETLPAKETVDVPV